MLFTKKRFASKFTPENRNCLSLPTKVGFFEKVPTHVNERFDTQMSYVTLIFEQEKSALQPMSHITMSHITMSRITMGRIKMGHIT